MCNCWIATLLFRKQQHFRKFPSLLRFLHGSETILTSTSYSCSRAHSTAAWRCHSHTQVWRHWNAERRIPGLAESLHRPKGASHFQHIQVPSKYLQIPPSWRAAESCSLATSIKLLTRAPWKISSHWRKSNLLQGMMEPTQPENRLTPHSFSGRASPCSQLNTKLSLTCVHLPLSCQTPVYMGRKHPASKESILVSPKSTLLTTDYIGYSLNNSIIV